MNDETKPQGDEERPQGWEGENRGIDQQPPAAGGGYGFYGQQNQNWGQPWQQPAYTEAPARKQKKPKKSKGGLIALLIVVCLVGGAAAGTFLVAPNIGNINGAQPGNLAMLPQDNETPSPTQGNAQTTDVPEIGGTVPDIDGAAANPIVQIAKEVGPSVVGVSVSVNQPMLGELESAQQESGYGTGIIVTQDGYIATNNHVVQGADSVKIKLFDGTEYQATVVGTDKTTDLAVIKIDATGLIPAALGDSDALEVGENVVAIGNPLGEELAGSVTSGIVSALKRVIPTNGFSQEYIQTDAAINPGNSGGALVNMKGQVIGINTLKTYMAGYDDYGVPIGTEGIGFAIPINHAKPIVEQLIATGSVQRPGIGISCFVDETHTVNPEGAPAGVTVSDVTKNGPAAQAGLQAGDIITAIDGTAVDTVDALTTILQSHAIGEKAELTVWRKGQEYKAVVTIGDLNNMG